MEKNAPIQISEKAAEEIRLIMEKKQVPEGYGLRVGMRGGGCGAAYFLGFDQRQSHDEHFTIAGIPVYIDKRHFMYLLDVEVDFEEQREERGFVFHKSMPTIGNTAATSA